MRISTLATQIYPESRFKSRRGLGLIRDCTSESGACSTHSMRAHDGEWRAAERACARAGVKGGAPVAQNVRGVPRQRHAAQRHAGRGRDARAQLRSRARARGQRRLERSGATAHREDGVDLCAVIIGRVEHSGLAWLGRSFEEPLQAKERLQRATRTLSLPSPPHLLPPTTTQWVRALGVPSFPRLISESSPTNCGNSCRGENAKNHSMHGSPGRALSDSPFSCFG